MKAVTVRVNDINGVAGFVLPGERVDVLLVRNLERSEAYADVLLQNVKVLAVDQLADESADKPALVKAVTVEVGTADAQKLTLAGTVGTLALTLRSAGDRRPRERPPDQRRRPHAAGRAGRSCPRRPRLGSGARKVRAAHGRREPRHEAPGIQRAGAWRARAAPRPTPPRPCRPRS